MDVVLETAGYYRLDKKQAMTIIDQVVDVVSGWQLCTRHYGLSRLECLEAEHLFYVR